MCFDFFDVELFDHLLDVDLDLSFIVDGWCCLLEMVTVGTGIFEVLVLLILNDRRGFAEAFGFFLAIGL